MRPPYNHMIESKDDREPSAETPLPNSRKVYVAGQLHPEISVPFREISLAPTKTMSGEIEANEPIRVYDTSGPWGDGDQHVDVTEGLPALRAKWIRDRGDVEETAGRPVTPQDDGFLSEKHAADAAQKRPTSNVQHPTSNLDGRNGRNGNLQSEIFNLKSRRPLRAKRGNAVTQLYYAREGIVTPEMEFIAIRENTRRAVTGLEPVGRGMGGGSDLSRIPNLKSEVDRNSLGHQHRGESFGANIPREIT
ncbi:MAG: phosphomethylpyrimidine synthase, partial [Verrucomicrobiota bacterium]